MDKKKTLMADLGLLLVAMLWGGGFIITKNTLDLIDPIYLTFLRFTLSAVLMGLLFFKNMKRANSSDLKAGIIIGLFMFAAFITQTVGLLYTTVSKQAFITASNVVMVPFIYWALTKKKPDNFEMFAAILCFVGIGIISLKKDLTMGLGDFLTLICAVFFAFHIISIGHFAKDHDPIVLTVVQFATVAVLSFISCLIFKIEFKPVSTEVAKSIGYMSLISTILAFGIQNVAQKYTTSTHAAILLSLESVFGTLFSVIFLKEEFTLRLLIGCITIFIAIITAETKWKFLRKSNT